MEINCETKLRNLVNSQKIIDTFTNATSNIKSDCTIPRLNYLETEIEKSAIKDAIISDSNTMYTSGLDVKSAYESFHTAFDNLQETITVAATNKEKEELRDLIDKVSTKIYDLEDDRAYYKKLKRNEEDASLIEEYDAEISNINRSIESYDKKKQQAIQRLNKLGEEYVETAAPTSNLSIPEENLVITQFDDTVIEYDETNPGVRKLEYYDDDGNLVTAEYTYDDQGKPVCTFTDAEGNVTVYAINEKGWVTTNGEVDNREYMHFEYFCIEDAADGSVIEIPVLLRSGMEFQIQPSGKPGGDNSYIHYIYFENITGNHFGGNSIMPSTNKYEVTNDQKEVTERIYYRDYQTQPFGRPAENQ